MDLLHHTCCVDGMSCITNGNSYIIFYLAVRVNFTCTMWQPIMFQSVPRACGGLCHTSHGVRRKIKQVSLFGSKITCREKRTKQPTIHSCISCHRYRSSFRVLQLQSLATIIHVQPNRRAINEITMTHTMLPTKGPQKGAVKIEVWGFEDTPRVVKVTCMMFTCVWLSK
jgi:hypothetical protein